MPAANDPSRPWTLRSILEDASSDGAGANEALIVGEQRWSFDELAHRADALAHFAQNEVGPTQSVAMLGENHADWVAGYYGIPAASRTLCFLNHRLSPAEIASQLQRASVGHLLLSDAERDRLDPVLRAQGAPPTTLFGAELSTPYGAAHRSPPHENVPAWLLFTSGTTGAPKGALLSHQSIRAALDASSGARPIRPDDVFCFPFPLCHVAGYNVLRLHQQSRPVVVLPRFSAAGFIDAVEENRVTSATVAATMLSSLLELLERDPAQLKRLQTLRTLAYGASPMPSDLLTKVDGMLGVELTQGYGMTELSGNAVFLDAADHRRGFAADPTLLRAAGRPGPGVEVRVVNEHGHALGPGHAGEIAVRGAQVMLGYLDDPDASQRAIRDGWMHTGDVGRWRDDGVLEVVDRLKDVIVTGGENVASLEVEDAISATCPEVAQVAVVGIPDARWGENVCCCIRLADGTSIDLATIRKRLSGQLAGFKMPRHLVILDALPETASGKVAKAALRSWLEEDPARAGDRVERDDAAPERQPSS